jgi:hypothetical protein
LYWATNFTISPCCYLIVSADFLEAESVGAAVSILLAVTSILTLVSILFILESFVVFKAPLPLQETTKTISRTPKSIFFNINDLIDQLPTQLVSQIKVDEKKYKILAFTDLW